MFLMAVMMSPAFAESMPVPVPDAADFAEAESLRLYDNRLNPAEPWYRGYQVGLGVPLAPLPFASVGGFVGYANKEARGFWKKRFGFRADFAISSPLKIKGYVEDDELYVKGTVFGISKKFNVGELDPIEFDDDSGATLIANVEGVNGVFSWKNQYFGALIDFYPFGNTWFAGGWRVSGGYYVGKADISLTASVPNYFPVHDGYAVEITDDIYAHARIKRDTKIGGNLHWNYRGPYVGAGFDLGIYRGFKFYTDFGIVFTKAPYMRENNLYIPERNFQACIANGVGCTPADWITIDITKPNTVRDELLAQAFSGLRNACVNGSVCEFGGVDYSGVASLLPPDIFNQVTAWMVDGIRPDWIDAVIAVDDTGGLSGIIREVELLAANHKPEFDLSKLTTEYYRIRDDEIEKANDALKDFKFIPMIRLGVMYRF